MSSPRLFELGNDAPNLRAFLRRVGLVSGDLPESATAHDQPQSELTSERRTFLFTDIEGSTNLVEAIGDDAWQELRRWHDRTLRALFDEHSGVEVDSAGDGFFVAFPDVTSAVDCAIAIQRTLEKHRQKSGFAPRVRVGIHEAEAIGEAGKWFGKGVHVAARIGAAAQGGQILASAASLEGAARVRLSDSQTLSMKGLQDAIDVVSVDWR
jgi:class 3 adenylate cyclase